MLFRRTLWITADQPSARAARWNSDISRAFVTDRLIHSFTLNADKALEVGETRPAGKSNGVYSGAFEPVANLMARVEVPTGKRTRADRILGFAIRCGCMSDLVWHETCVIAQGKLRGMIVSAAAGDDEREMFHFESDRLDPDARLDGRLFETGREWRAGD